MKPLTASPILLAFLLSAAAHSQPTPPAQKIFQIGDFDRTSSEFAGGAPKAPVDFVVGRSTVRQWLSVQTAIAANSTASDPATAPRSIRFTLPEAPSPAYRLHVALILDSRALPALRITVNGHRGTFYLTSQLSSTLGSMDDSFETAFSPADVLADISGSFLHSGENTITLQAVESDEPTGTLETLNYDAIELYTLPDPPDPNRAKIVPTIFYRQQGGHLTETIDAYILHDTPAKSGSSVNLTLAGQHFTGAFPAGEDFGEARVEFAVPDFPAQSHAQLTWTTEGQPLHAEETINPGKKWTVLIVPQEHLDIGYSDYQSKVATIQTRALDQAMDFTAKTPDFRYSSDGAWVLDRFLHTRSLADQQRLITAMKSGTLFIPAEYANLLTGFPTAETLIRSLYFSANFSREHGTPFDYADITDVPSYSWSYASILAAAGIKYFIAGPNGHETRAPVLLQGRLNENSPFYWQGPDGNKVLFWYARHYFELGVYFGTPPLLASAKQMLPIVLHPYERPTYRPDSIILYGSQQENTDLFPEQSTFAARWNALYAYPRFEYSGFSAAMQKIAAASGDSIPTIRGDGGPYWEDGIAADARIAAIERRNEALAPAAEQLATLTSIVNPRLAPDKEELDRMWTSMVLMDEHTYTSKDTWNDPTSDESVQQTAVKHRDAESAAAIVDFVTRTSMASLADSISAPHRSILVFNTLNWPRTGSVLFDLPHGDEIVDSATGNPVPTEFLTDSRGLTHVRFTASNVPATGYKVFTLRHIANPIAPAPTGIATEFENSFYRVTLDPETGALSSLFDKQQQRELVDRTSPYRFGQVLYVAGGDQRPNTLLQYRTVRIPPTLQVTGAHAGKLLSTTRTLDGWVARIQTSAPNTPIITTEIRLDDNRKTIEFTTDFDKPAIYLRESVYFAFPFAMDKPQFQYEIQNGVVDPAHDMYPGAGHDWFSVQHWVSVQQDGLSATVMPLDAGLVTLGDLYRGLWPPTFGDRKGSIFSFAMNNHWSGNYPSGQGGHFRFRYAVTSAPTTQPAQLSRLGWEETTPLQSEEITGQDKADDKTPRLMPGTQSSFLQIDDPAVLVEAWKSAEDGNGTILRLLDLGGSERQLDIRIPLLTLAKIIQTDAVERDHQPIPLLDPHHLQITIHPHEILTLRLIPQP